MSDFKKAYELWNKNPKEDFSDSELAFLKNHLSKKKYKVKYGFYNRKSSKGKYISVIFDLMPLQNRKTGSENNWDVIAEREMTEGELNEFIIFHYRNSFKRFLVFYYKDLEKLLIDDIKLGAKTPYEFIKQCENKGYKGNYQSKIEFEFN